MTGILLYIFGCFGLAFILGHAEISELPRAWIHALKWPGRFLVRLLECPGCLGFWLGIAWGAFHHAGWLVSLGYGVATSGTNLFLALYTGLIAKPHSMKDAGAAAGALAASFENHRYGALPPPICSGVGRWPVTLVGSGGGTCGICGRVISLNAEGNIAVHPYISEE